MGYAGYGDGSFNTYGVRIELKKPMSKAQVEQLIADTNVGMVGEQQKLAGLTATDEYLETYYAGESDNFTDRPNFTNATKRLAASIGKDGRRFNPISQRLWVYGRGAVPYGRNNSGIHTTQTLYRKSQTGKIGLSVAKASLPLKNVPDFLTQDIEV